MKLKKLHACLVVILIAFCPIAAYTQSKPGQGIEFGAGQICLPVQTNEKEGCVQVSGDHMAVLRRVDGKLSARPVLASAVMDGIKTPKSAAAAQLQTMLQKKGKLFTFDPESTTLRWEGDQLSLYDKLQGQALYVANMSDARGVLLIPSDIPNTISLALYGLRDCPNPIALNPILDSIGDNAQSLIYVSGGKLLLGGGHVIIVIDPAILEDPEKMVIPKFDPKIWEWIRNEIESGKPGCMPGFLTIETHESLPSKASLTQKRSTQIVTTEDKVAFAAYERLVENEVNEICAFRNDLKALYSCGAILYLVDRETGKTEATFDVQACPVTLETLDGVTRIYRALNCIDAVPNEGCR